MMLKNREHLRRQFLIGLSAMLGTIILAALAVSARSLSRCLYRASNKRRFTIGRRLPRH
jgi:hypothetical protein